MVNNRPNEILKLDGFFTEKTAWVLQNAMNRMLLRMGVDILKSLAFFPIGRMAITGSVLFFVGCQNAAMDSEAFHSVNGDRHNFLVSHVFNKTIYEDRLMSNENGASSELGIGGELGESTSTLFTCFYELEISQAELSQCSSEQDSAVNAIQGEHLNALEIWRLMALHESKTQTLTEYIVPNKQLLSEAKSNWERTPETQSLIVQSEESDGAAHEVRESSTPHEDAFAMPAYAIFGGLNGGINQLIANHLPNVTGKLLNTVSCLALGLASENSGQKIIESTLQAFNPILGSASIPVNLGFGILRGVTGFIGKIVGAEKLAATHCGRTAADAITERANSQAPVAELISPPESDNQAQLALQAADAIRDNNTQELQEILNLPELLATEMERSAKSLRADGDRFDMSATLSQNYEKMSQKNVEELKVNLRNLSLKIGNETGKAMCPRPEIFVRKVLIPALEAASKAGHVPSFDANQKGCRPATAPSVTQTSAGSNESAPETTGTATADVRELRSTIQELDEKIGQARTVLERMCRERPEECAADAK